MNFKFLIIILLSLSVSLSLPLSADISEGEALFVRRILQFWKERDAVLVKAQILDFLKQYPESQYRDSLLVMFGDLEWGEGNYETALDAYNRVCAANLQDKIFNNRLDCLYRLGRYEDLKRALDSKGQFHQKELLSRDELLWLFFYAEALLHQATGDSTEATESLVDQAKSHYQKLLESDHKVNAHLALGEIHVILGAPDQAAAHYLEASKGVPDREEELILQAAHLKGTYQPEDALILFERVRKMEGEKSGEAALAKAALLFKQEDYNELVEAAEELSINLDPREKYLLNIYIGRSFLALNRYESTIELLEPLKGVNYDNSEAQKTIYLTLIVSYEQLNMAKETIQAVDLFKEKFPSDEALPKVLYLEALSLKSLERYEEALALMELLIEDYPEDENRESLEFEHALVLFKLGRWQESRDGFVQFLKKYPATLLEYSAVSYAAHASVKKSEEEIPPTKISREQLVTDLERVIAHPSSSSNPQKPKYLLLLAKADVELNNYDDAKKAAESYVSLYPRDEDLFQGYLLLASCCKEGDHDLVGFTDHGEHILRIKPDYQDGEVLRLNLFGAYLDLAKETSQKMDKESELYLDLAADHLYHVMNQDSSLVKHENKLWLANHYYGKSAEGCNDYYIDHLEDPEKLELAHKSIACYELSLIKNEKLNKENLHLEADLLKWSHLYGWVGETNKQISVLEGLVEQQTTQKSLPWRLRSRSQFALARAYHAAGYSERAMKIYEGLRAQSKNSDLTVMNGAQLEWARLKLALIPPEKRLVDNPQVEIVLKTLKELQAKKSLPQEPIHLEAAMDYAALRASLEMNDRQLDQYKILLVKMKENFSSREDLWSKDYYASRQMHPDKDFIYQAYMMLLDAHLIGIEAKIAAHEGRKVEGEVKAETAKAIYRSLLKGKLAVSKYLVDQAKVALKELEN